jgi:hypothetical protein
MSLADNASSPSVGAVPRAIGEPSSPPGRERTLLIGGGLCALSAVATIDPGATDHPAASVAGLLLGAGLPFAVLAAGASTRFAGERGPLLLFGVPAAVGAASLARPSVPLEPVVFAAFALTLLAYVVSAARWLAQPTEPTTTTPRAGEPTPARLVRRVRVYRVLKWMSALVFAVPLGMAVIGVAGGATQPLLSVSLAGLLGALACRAFIVDALERHLQRDPALVASLSRLRRHARRGRPGRLFYLAALIALIGMTLYATRQLLGLGEAP